jgi:hypothetical protein
MAEEQKVGFNAHRLKPGDPYYKKEVDFVKAINQEIKYNKGFLAGIVNHPDHKEWLEEDQEKIVLSVIQWLGTPVGQGFLEKVSNVVL